MNDTEQRPKLPCKFCGHLYRSNMTYNGKRTINCQNCLVDFYWKDDQLTGIRYRLRNTPTSYKSMFMCVDVGVTYLHYYPKSKKKDIKLEGAWPDTKPHETSVLINRLEKLLVFA